MTVSELKDFEEIKFEIEAVKSIILTHTQSKYQEVQYIIEDTLNLNGKMLRPILLIISAHFGEAYDSRRMTALASSIEMMHMATLIHDDIIDDSEMRRNNQSVQSKYGKDLAVYAGDHLLAKSLTVLKPEDYKHDQVALLGHAIEQICESELMQYFNRYHQMTVKNYLKVISGKTAALFAMSMYVGAIESGASQALANMFKKIGYEIGIAFQIIDDILDFDEKQSVVGKTVRNDLKKGYYTLPLIYAFENQSIKPDEYTESELVEKINANKGIEKSRRLAKKYSQKAFSRINRLPKTKYQEMLNLLANDLLNRNY